MRTREHLYLSILHKLKQSVMFANLILILVDQATIVELIQWILVHTHVVEKLIRLLYLVHVVQLLIDEGLKWISN